MIRTDNMLNKESKKDVGVLLFIALCTLVLGVCYYRRITFIHDIYASYSQYAEMLEYGRFPSLAEMIRGQRWLMVFVMGVFQGNAIRCTKMLMVAPIMLTLFLLFLYCARLCFSMAEKILSVLFVGVILVPICGSAEMWMYHNNEMALTIIGFAVWYYQCKKNNSWVIKLITALVYTVGAIYLSTVFVFISYFIPVGILLFLELMERKKGKALVYCLLLTSIGLVILKATGITDWVYQGYGGDSYIQFAGAGDWLNRFVLINKYLVEGWGVDFEGQTLIQGQTALYMVKYVFVFLCISGTVIGLYRLMATRKTKNRDILLMSAMINIGLMVIAQPITPGGDYRYIIAAHYFIPMFSTLELTEIFLYRKNARDINGSKEMKCVLISLVLILIVLISETEKTMPYNGTDKTMAEVTMEKKAYFGMGDLSNIYANNVLTNGTVKGFSSYESEQGVIQHFEIPFSYYNGANKYCFIYDGPEALWDGAFINEYYEDYTSSYVSDSYVVYFYDYDIRWQETRCDGMGQKREADEQYSGKKLTDESSMIISTYIPIGTTRIIVNGSELENANITASNPALISLKKVSDNQLIVELTTSKECGLQLTIDNIKNACVDDIVERLVYAAYDLTISDFENVGVEVGQNTELFVEGNKMNKCTVNVNDEALEPEQSGTRYSVYRVADEIDRDNIITGTVTDSKNITRISLQNTFKRISAIVSQGFDLAIVYE